MKMTHVLLRAPSRSREKRTITENHAAQIDANFLEQFLTVGGDGRNNRYAADPMQH